MYDYKDYKTCYYYIYYIYIYNISKTWYNIFSCLCNLLVIFYYRKFKEEMFILHID